MLIRRSTPADRTALYDVCIKTGDDGRDATDVYANPVLLPEVYLGAYLTLAPEYCWTVDHDGAAVGYLVGTDDTADFERRCEAEWWPALRARYPRDSAPAGSRDANLLRLIHERSIPSDPWLPDYPAHLHIDLLPITQGHGLGRKLIDTFESALRANDVPGLHLGVSSANEHAVGFYRHLGFEELASGPGYFTLGKRLTP